MKKLCTTLFLTILYISVISGQEDKKRITSIVDTSHLSNLALIQDFILDAPINEVWEAYTTKEGWENWATAKAEVDFKINGTIKTNYNVDGEIGDSNTIVLHVLNYVPNKLITLQAELSTHFPDFMKEDEKDLFNIVYFDELGPTKTKITSYGIGYRNNDKYLSLLKFFIQGNELSYQNLINYLEKGIKAKY